MTQKEESIKIYIITHKKYDILQMQGYTPLMVGSSKKSFIPDGYAKDNEGDNISELNDSYCELTGLYWMWKNDNSDLVGLVHYRRYFANVKKSFIYRGRYILLNKKNAYSILSVNDAKEQLRDCDILVKRSEKRRADNWGVFTKYLGIEYCELVRSVLKNESPDYADEFDNVMSCHTHINCNMFIGKKHISDRYCEWLFPIIEAVDRKHKEDCGDRYHNRELGYIGEMLFEVWLRKNKIKYKVVKVVNIDDKYAVGGVMNIPEFITFFVKKSLEKLKGK